MIGRVLGKDYDIETILEFRDEKAISIRRYKGSLIGLVQGDKVYVGESFKNEKDETLGAGDYLVDKIINYGHFSSDEDLIGIHYILLKE